MGRGVVRLLNWRKPKPARFIEHAWPKRLASFVSVLLAVGLVVVGGYLGVTLVDGFGSIDVLLVVAALVIIGLQDLVRRFVSNLERGDESAKQTFADNLPKAIERIISFMSTGMAEGDAEQLRKDLTEATSAMVAGDRRGRVCVYWVDRRDVEKGKDNRFLVRVHSDGRGDQSRHVFTPDEPHGEALIKAVFEGDQIPVQNSKRPPRELPVIDTRGPKKYQSFILTPIQRNGTTRGAVMVDYEGTGHLTKIDGAMSEAIARIFESSFAVIKHGGEDLSKRERRDVRSDVEAIQALKRRLRGDIDG